MIVKYEYNYNTTIQENIQKILTPYIYLNILNIFHPHVIATMPPKNAEIALLPGICPQYGTGSSGKSMLVLPNGLPGNY